MFWLRSRFPASAPLSEPVKPDALADPRLELVLDQVLRGLSQQQATLDSLRARAGTLVATASLVSTVFGATALAEKSRPPATIWVILAFLFLFLVVAAAFVIILPYEWKWGIDGHRLLADYVEDDPPATLDETRRSLAYYIQQDINTNDRKLDRLWVALRVAVVAVGIEVLFWALALSSR